VTTFIILCAARTGSTMLRQLLDSHPEVCCYGEIMASAVTPDHWESAARIRRKVLERYPQAHGIFVMPPSYAKRSKSRSRRAWCMESPTNSCSTLQPSDGRA